MTTKDIPVLLKKHPFTAICAGLSVLLAAVYFVRQGSVPDSESLLNEKTSESRRLKANISNAASLKEHVAALEEANRKIDQRLMRAADLAKNQQYFYKIEADTGVKILDLRPGGLTAAGGAKPVVTVKKYYSSVPYTCTVQGTFSQILAFLKKIEEGEHFQRILMAAVSVSGGTNDDETSSADPALSLSITIDFLGQS